MGPVDWLLAAGGLIGAPLAWRWFASRRGRAACDWQERRILVRGGYHPEEVHVREGVAVRLMFQREETAACSERVVFPDLGISATLPAWRETAVELPVTQAGTHPFTCEMEILHGRLIVDPAGRDRTDVPPDVPVAA
jgi:Cu+-exporting ATPase